MSWLVPKRLHGWAADRLDSVQYPPERKRFIGYRWTVQMPLHIRLGVILLSAMVAIIAGGFAIFMGVIAWAFFSSLGAT